MSDPQKSDPEKPPSPVHRIFQFLSLAILAAALYDGAIFYSRWSSARHLERQQAAQEAEQARKDVALIGDDHLRIVNFYASPAAARAGQPVDLCYGVRGAKTLQLEPADAEVWPALTRCVQISPRKDTVYKLTAADAAGHTVSESVELKVLH
jgi:hypothetical protein